MPLMPLLPLMQVMPLLPLVPLLPNASMSRPDHHNPICPQTPTPRTHGTLPIRVSRQQLQHLTARLVTTQAPKPRLQPAPSMNGKSVKLQYLLIFEFFAVTRVYTLFIFSKSGFRVSCHVSCHSCHYCHSCKSCHSCLSYHSCQTPQ